MLIPCSRHLFSYTRVSNHFGKGRMGTFLRMYEHKLSCGVIQSMLNDHWVTLYILWHSHLSLFVSKFFHVPYRDVFKFILFFFYFYSFGKHRFHQTCKLLSAIHTRRPLLSGFFPECKNLFRCHLEEKEKCCSQRTVVNVRTIFDLPALIKYRKLLDRNI